MHAILFSDLQNTLLNDAVRYLHLLAVAIGLGTSFVADATVFRRLKYPLTDGFLAMLHWCHQLVTFALVFMWLSGIALIYMRTGFVWDNFSPKLIAKIVVVSILTLNAMLIGAYAMPNLKRSVGVCPKDLSVRMQLPMAFVAGVSTTSWLLALSLGSSVFLKQAGADLFVILLPASYLICVFASTAAVAIMHRANGNAGPERTPAE